MLTYTLGAEVQELTGSWLLRAGVGVGQAFLSTGSRYPPTPTFDVTSTIFEARVAGHYLIIGDNHYALMTGLDAGFDFGPLRGWTITVPLTMTIF